MPAINRFFICNGKIIRQFLGLNCSEINYRLDKDEISLKLRWVIRENTSAGNHRRFTSSALICDL